MRRVMISYSSRQRDVADRVREWLEAEGHSPKLDHLDIAPGDRFASTLAWWLAACHVAVVLISEDALASPWVRYELSVLVNREREGSDARIVLVLLDGLELATVASRPDLAPLHLASLQARAWTGPTTGLTDETIAGLLSGALDDTTDAPIEALAGRARDGFREAGDDAVARARRALLRRVGEEPDPWRDDPAAGDTGALRWALAKDLCSHSLKVAYHAVAALAEDSQMERAVFSLVDLNLMGSFDPAALRTIYGAWFGTPRPGAVVLGFTTEVHARLATKAVHLMHDTDLPFLKPIVNPLTGTSADEMVEGIVGELEASLADDEVGLDDYLAESAAGGHLVVLVLTRPEGLSAEILSRLGQRLPGVGVMVLASRRAGPESWSGRLFGAPVAGPQLEGSAWADFVGLEELLVTERDRARKNLRRVIAER